MPHVTQLNDYFNFNWSSLTPIVKNGDQLHDTLASYYPMFYPWQVPVYSVIAYLLLSDVIFGFIRKVFKTDPNSKNDTYDTILKLVTILHSTALTIYSGWTFYNAASILSTQYMSIINQQGTDWSLSSIYSAYMTMSCDKQGTLWTDKDFGFWVSHFYISKFWEFLDTWIIILKGKKPILLQTYHHAGVVLLMWMFTVSHNSACGLMITFLNSGIHTMMYCYFTITAFGVKSLNKYKPMITSMQLIQFVVGITFTIPTYSVFNPGCNNEAQHWGTIGIHVYTIILIGLFLDFAKKNYIDKDKNKDKNGSKVGSSDKKKN